MSFKLRIIMVLLNLLPTVIAEINSAVKKVEGDVDGKSKISDTIHGVISVLESVVKIII